MNSFLSGLRAAVVLTLAILVMAPTVASAQSRWQPEFKSGTHVYIDPAMANDPLYPVVLPGLEEKLAAVSAKHGIEVLAVTVQQTNETGGNPSLARVDDLILRWQSKPGFPHGKYLILLWMRSASNPSSGWVGGNVGSDLKVYGIDKANLDSDTGIMGPAAKKYMPQDPTGFYVAVTAAVNQKIDDYNANKQREAERAEARKSLPLKIFAGVVILGIAGFGFVRWRAFETKKSQVGSELADWTTKMESANALHIRLKTGYLGFLMTEEDWRTKFKGETLSQFEAAVSAFADFSARTKKANEVYNLAKGKIGSANMFATGGLDAGNALLTETVITVDGDAIALENATLFGGLIKKTDYKPKALLDSMEALFATTNSSLAAIVRALNEARDAGLVLDTVQGEIDVLKTRFNEARPFTRFEAAYTKLNADEVQVRQGFGSDPISAKGAMDALVARANNLKGDIEQALAA